MTANLESRLSRIERLNRMLLLALVGLLVLVLAGGRAPEPGEPTIRTTRLEIVDSDGVVRAVLGADDAGAHGLFVHDSLGGMRLSLTHDFEQTALFLYDDAGTTRVGVAQFAHGGGGVALHGTDGKGAAVLYHKEAGSLAFYDAEGRATTRIPAAQD